MRRRWLAGSWPSILVGALAAAQDGAVPVDGADARSAEPVVAIDIGNAGTLRLAFEYLYNLDFDPALEAFAKLDAAEPDSAAVAAFWSSALLYRMLAQQGSLQSQLFVTNDFFRRPPPPVDRELEARYLGARADAENRAARRMAIDPDDVDALFGLGLVYGNTANYLAGVRGEYLSGLRFGERAFDLHQRLREMRPDIHDTGLVLGVHEYVLSTLPRAMRLLLFFVGAHGDREDGFAYMREAADHGEFLGAYAAVLLAMASIREHDLTTATTLAESLATRYPRNPLLRLELLKLYREQRRLGEAEQLARRLLDDLASDTREVTLLDSVRLQVSEEIARIAELRAQ